ncbi:MAG: hypothetical protein J5910_01415 [Lachnospiraceae bacterium]|nr:hypothetical protein [Lachnospiraceae bacterium]
MIGMVVPQETIRKMETLPSEKMNIIVQIVDQMSMSPLDMFNELRSEGVKKNLSDEEIDSFVESVKLERYAASNRY